jgi:thiosulfate/3-mercaptopyruvate sulfurtransferase
MKSSDAAVVDGLLVTGDWLEANLSDPAIRIVDARKCDGYDEAHIAGAAKITARPFLRENGDVIAPASFSAAMADLGIGPDTTVVAYDDGNNLFAGRLWFVLNYYGHRNVKVLDGGWDLWKAEGRPVDGQATVPAKVVFEAAPEAGWLADTAYVAQSWRHRIASSWIREAWKSGGAWSNRVRQHPATSPARHISSGAM